MTHFQNSSIYEFNKMMSNPTKARLIVHLATCFCSSHWVLNLAKKLKSKQSNISKHLADLRKKQVVSYVRDKKQIFYFINKKWLSKYLEIMKLLVKVDENKLFVCECNDGKIII